MNKNDTSWNYQKFMDQYNKEQQANNTPQQTSNESNFNNQNDTNWQNSEKKVYNPTTWYYETEKPKQNFDTTKSYSSDLDTSKFNEAPWQITVKEWTAQQTGKPDYQLSSEARLNEMKGNLDQYFKDSPRMFSDRETFNRVFDYNNRESDAQRQLLDSYWKRKEDMDKASTYTSWEAINNWMKNWEITTDQLNLLKEYNPEAYQKWQQLQEDEIMKRIVNDIVPSTIEAISTKINWMIEALGIQAQEALDIEWIYNDTMTKTWAWQTLEDANNTVKQIEAITNKKTAIMNRYASSTWWTVSDALAAARMAKAIAPYNEQLQGLQYQYQDYANLYSQKTATATQAANVRAMQAQENQRIWNQKCSALGFATSALSYRTPEEQAELQLKTLQAQNEINLLNQSRLNDLNRYNTYATTKMQNQLQAELTDLSVEDEQQLKANLNNVLSDYYKNYWDIIQRSQAQVVDDVIAYAKKNWISVAQALSENFIKPLQNKKEYKQKIASSYWMLSKQSITKINWKDVILTTNPNWSISYQYIEDLDSVKSTAKPYDLVDEKVFDVSPQSHSYYTLRDFIDDPDNKEWTYGWQCAKFVNDYLENIWVGRYFWNEDIKTRASWCNSDVAKVWTIAVFDYNNTSSDGINHGHVWVVIDTDDKWYWVLESNFDKNNPGKISKRYVLNWSSSCKGFFDPSKQPSAISSGEADTFEWNWNIYDFSKYSWWNNLTDDEKLTVENLLTYQTDPASLPKSWKDNWASNQRVRAAAAAIGRDNGYSERKFQLVKNAEKKWDDAALPWGVSSSNSTAMSILKAVSDSYSELENYDIQTVNSWINAFKTEMWDTTTLATYTDLNVAAAEIAKALKGGASATQDEKKEIEQLLNWKMNTAQAKAVFKHFAKNLYEKNESEAKKFYETTWYKPNSIWTDETSEWMSDSMGIDLSKYYNYVSENTSWPRDQVDAIWKDVYENTYGISFEDVASLVNW